MIASIPASPVHNSLGLARERDARIVRLLNMHPVTAGMLVSIGWFPTKKKALKRLRRLVQRRKIRLVGTVCRKPGRPEHVYCRWRPKPDQLLHEVELTDLCFRLHASRIFRGPQIRDTVIRPDAEAWINGELYFLELDRGTMGHRQLAGRFRKYAGCPHFSLWVCSSRERMEAMRLGATSLNATALFTTYAEAILDPHGRIWRDCRGGVAALPREKKPGE